MAWVSPRVNRAEPWARGGMPVPTEGADHFRIATVDTRLTTYDATTDDAALQAVELFADLLGIFFHAGCDDLLDHAALDGSDGFVTNNLLGDTVGFTQFSWPVRQLWLSALR